MNKDAELERLYKEVSEHSDLKIEVVRLKNALLTMKDQYESGKYFKHYENGVRGFLKELGFDQGTKDEGGENE